MPKRPSELKLFSIFFIDNFQAIDKNIENTKYLRAIFPFRLFSVKFKQVSKRKKSFFIIFFSYVIYYFPISIKIWPGNTPPSLMTNCRAVHNEIKWKGKHYLSPFLFCIVADVATYEK